MLDRLHSHVIAFLHLKGILCFGHLIQKVIRASKRVCHATRSSMTHARPSTGSINQPNLQEIDYG